MRSVSTWLVTVCLLGLGPKAHAVQAIPQRGYDAGVTGANLTESKLNISNVTTGEFGLLFRLPVDDAIFAQPLYVPNVSIPSRGMRNVLYVATMNDTVYAFDADTGGAPLWSVNLARMVGASPAPMANFAFLGNRNIVGNLGILSTPVIDVSSGVMYVIACTIENSTLAYRLHALDITSGAEPYGAGILIHGSYGASNFNSRYQTQRVSLVLSGNYVVFGFGAVQEEGPNTYVGWVMAYDKHTLQQSGVFATQTTGPGGGGVWQSGRPPAVDGLGYVYVFTGNGWGGGYDGVNNFSESALKLNPSNGLRLVDWFTPSDWSTLDSNDQDLTSSGPMLLPGTNLLAGGGKDGELYVLNTDNLGRSNANDSQIVQKEAIATSEIRGGPVYWQRSAANGGPLLYDWAVDDYVRAYAFNGTTFASSPATRGSGSQVYPGGILALSANGEQHGSGVLWATVAVSGDAAGNPPVPGELRAFDAEDVSHELWNSTMNASSDGFGDLAKFVPPVVANGKVYVASWSSQVAVYGLLSSYSVTPASLGFGSQLIGVASGPMSVTVTNTGKVSLPIASITVSTSGSKPFSQTNTCGTSVPVGGTCTASVTFTPGSPGPVNATLSINTSGGAGTQTVSLTGTGVTPSYSVSPPSLAFGNQTINVTSAPLSVTVANTGTVLLPITSIILSTPGSHPFSQSSNCGASVAVGGRCTVIVVFNPSTTGLASGILSINAGGGAGEQTVSLSGAGVAPTYSVTPTTLAFGDQTLGVTSSPLAVTLTNTGLVAVPVAGIGLSGPGSSVFSQTNTCGSSLAVGARCTANVAFTPDATGSATTTLNINAGLTPSTVSLSGTGDFQVTLTASSQSVTMGVPVTLTWSSAPSATCAATGGTDTDGWNGKLAAKGTQAVTENASGTYNYGLSCSVASASATATASVAVTAPSVKLSAAPSTIDVGQSATLTWTSQDASSCVGSGGQTGDAWDGTKSDASSMTVTPVSAGTVTYTITCTSGPQSAEAVVQIVVVSPQRSGGGALDTITLLFVLMALGLHRGAVRTRALWNGCASWNSSAEEFDCQLGKEDGAGDGNRNPCCITPNAHYS